MSCYLLLRNNVESGPFTFDELTAHALRPNDLIWIEGRSVAWRHPMEIEVLQPFVAVPVAEQKQESANDHTNIAKSIFVALPQSHQQAPVLKNSAPEPMLKTRFSQPLETLRENYYAPKKHTSFSFSKTFSKSHNVAWIFSVFAGLLLSAILIKKIVDAYDENSAVAAAALPVYDKDDLKSPPEESLYQNALTTEFVPVDTITMKPVKRTPLKINLKKLVRLETNDYQVGMFGGIKNLRLLLTNKSGYVLDKVKIELHYLKPNGAILKTEKLTMKAVAPKSSKSLAVASEKRGVKITYRITDIQSKQSAETTVNL